MNHAALFTVLMIGTIGLAQAQTTSPPPNALLAARLQAGATLERYLQNMRQEFLRLDADGNGKLDAADIEMHTIIGRAMFRNSFAMQIMVADLDGDGVVTADEMRRKLHYDRRNLASHGAPATPSPEQQIDAQVRKWLEADIDKDGKVTWHEALEAATRDPNYGRSIQQSFGSLIQQLQELAPQGAAVTLADLEAAATAFFRRVDTDNNGTISTDVLLRVINLGQDASQFS
jgi:Ca2+-binding EF-hand superfamily protein